MPYLVRALVLLLVSTPTWGQEGDFTLRVEVPVVTVDVSVTTPDGWPVDGLEAGDFQVFDGGTEQPIRYFGPQRAPWHVYLLLDTSASTEAQRGFMAAVVSAFLGEVRPQDRVAIGVFGEQTETIVGWSELPETGFPVESRLSVPGAAGTTALYQSLERVLTKEFSEISERRAVIVLTDGRDASLYQTLQRAGRLLVPEDDPDFLEAADAASESRIPLYFVGMNTDLNIAPSGAGNEYRSLGILYPDSDLPTAYLRQVRLRMERLAEVSGGELLLPESPDEVIPTLAEIIGRLGAAYSLGWVPESSGGEARSIEVRVRDADYLIRTSRTLYRP
jgi:VWFA-related protein